MSRKMKSKKDKKKIVVAVSGGFDPVHVGHVRLFQQARALGDELVVILNNDNWLKKKKGYTFMPEKERKEIIEAFAGVDRVVLTKHPPNPKDISVCAELKKVKPDIFAQGGDRNTANIPPCEVRLQKELDFKVVENVGRGGKVQSSSWLIAKLHEGGRDKP
jgi:cytidyltransferase-like protein